MTKQQFVSTASRAVSGHGGWWISLALIVGCSSPVDPGATGDGDDALPQDAVSRAEIQGDDFNCGPKPTVPPPPCGVYACVLLDDGWHWETVPADPGDPCGTEGGHCDAGANCVVAFTPGKISGLAMADVSSTNVTMDCADGDGTITQHLSLSVNGGGFQDLGFNACTKGARITYHDITNVAPQRQLCYKLDAIGADQSSTATACITVPVDTTSPAAPILQVTPFVRGVNVVYIDQSINETRFRAWVCLTAVQSVVPVPPTTPGDCALQQEIDFPAANHSTGTAYGFNLNGMDPARTYQVKVEAWHDHDAHGTEVWSSVFHPRSSLSAASDSESATE